MGSTFASRNLATNSAESSVSPPLEGTMFERAGTFDEATSLFTTQHHQAPTQVCRQIDPNVKDLKRPPIMR